MWAKMLCGVVLFSSLIVRVDEAALTPPDGVRRPAEIYFGAYRRNEPLADHPEQWRFVREHVDGFLMHFGFWLNNDYDADPIGTAKKLGPILQQAKLRTLLEIGFPSRNAPPDRVFDMGRQYGRLYAEKIKQFESQSGMRVDEIECELRLFIFKDIARAFPDWTAAEIAQQVTGETVPGHSRSSRADRAYWPEFLDTMRRELGQRPIHIGCPPVYVPWKGLFTAANEFKFEHPTANALNPAVIEIESRSFWGDMLNDRTTGFVCDSPWYLMAHPVYAERGYRKKVVDFERFVHGQGKRFTFIANNAVDEKLPPEEWDRSYLQDSMKALTTFQIDGGRADRYVFESWYAGPHTIVPEDQAGTFTNLVKAAINYLKGPGQDLLLGVSGAGAPVAGKDGVVPIQGSRAEIELKNLGDCAALPAIRFVVPGASSQLRVKLGGVDVSRAAGSQEGVTPSNLLRPGESLVLTIEGNGRMELQAFWNPQDPSGTPRDTLILQFSE